MNFQSSLDTIIAGVSASQAQPSLLLHACCAPCASYVIEYLAPYFDVTLSFFNPNIQPREEYDRRLAELYRLLELTNRNINVIEGAYFDRSWGNCADCIGLRIDNTAKLAADKGFDYFCSTLSISPHKNAELINELGLSAASEYGSKWLPNDFKKRNGYLRSVQICRELNIYRQSYCGCLANK
jgi:predicted adenine nucleotide alpha hydrolase (AANH) superfamily ATPase